MEENTVTTDAGGLESLARLEERILETVEQLRACRREKAELEKDSALLRERLVQSEQRAGELAAEVESFRVERRQVGERVQKLLVQIDLLSQG